VHVAVDADAQINQPTY